MTELNGTESLALSPLTLLLLSSLSSRPLSSLLTTRLGLSENEHSLSTPDAQICSCSAIGQRNGKSGRAGNGIRNLLI
jgi:hypothetical protein